MKHFVYRTTNLVNSKYYIGVHSCNCNPCHYLGSGVTLKKAIKKYGRHNFKREILKEFSSREEAFEYETHLVDKKDRKSYNLVSGGRGALLGFNNPMKGKLVSDLTRKKLSDSHKGQDTSKARASSLKTNSKPVIIKDKKYKSISEAARILSIHRCTVTSRLNSKNFLDYRRINSNI